MNELSALHPKRLKWRMEWLFQVAAEWVIARLPGRMVFLLGEFIGGGLWYLMGERRRIVLKNLRIAYGGEKGMDELRDLARASFRRSVANLLSAVHTAHVDLDRLESCVTIENPELAEEAAKEGKGILFLPPHMGNWEILARMNRLYPQGHEAGAFYRPLNNPYLDARVAGKRMSEGTRLFSKRDSLHQVGGFLRNGGMIGILADQRAGRQGTLVSFFGRLTRSSPLPGLLIRRCKCPSLAISLRTIQPGKWSIRYHQVHAPGDTAACMDAIERAMRESPVDVFWFQDRWKTYVSRKLDLRKWLGDDEMRSQRHGHRVLVWLAGSPEGWRVTDPWRHGDARYEYVLFDGFAVPDWIEADAVVHWIGDLKSVHRMRRELRRIDTTDPLPVDFVLTGNEGKKLMRACKCEAIRLISVPI